MLTGCARWLPFTLTHAAMVGDGPQMQAALDHGADINCIDDAGWTPLLWTVYYRYYENMLYLIARGANINAATEKDYYSIPRGSTALIIAIYYNQCNFVRELVKRGANLYAQNSKGDMPIDLAKTYGCADEIEAYKPR